MNAESIEALFATPTPAHLGSDARAGVWEARMVRDQVRETAAAGTPSGDSLDCLLALVLLWHDHPDDAHALVQDLSGSNAAFVHGIVHRREPDYTNARYWFHRVGNHPALEPLADAVAPMLAACTALPFRLIRDGRWDPLAFIEAVASLGRRPAGSSEVTLLEGLQRLESLVLARHLARR